MDYELLLENPRKRRRRRARRRPTRRKARRRSPRRRTRRRSRSTTITVRNPRRRSRRRAAARGIFGGLQQALTGGVSIASADFAGDLLTRAIVRFTPVLNFIPGGRPAWVRIGLGFLADPLLKFVNVPSRWRKLIGSVNVASGIVGLTMPMRLNLWGQLNLRYGGMQGLGDWETVGQGDYGVLGRIPASPYGMLGDWETMGPGANRFAGVGMGPTWEHGY